MQKWTGVDKPRPCVADKDAVGLCPRIPQLRLQSLLSKVWRAVAKAPSCRGSKSFPALGTGLQAGYECQSWQRGAQAAPEACVRKSAAGLLLIDDLASIPGIVATERGDSLFERFGAHDRNEAGSILRFKERTHEEQVVFLACYGNEIQV